MATGTIRIYRPGPMPADETHRCGRATFSVSFPSLTRVTVAVNGDVDATNGRDMGRYVERHTGISKQLVLDLHGVDFFGSDGFPALYYISVHCARSDVDWMIVGSPAVRRLLSICDVERELPLVRDPLSALARFDRLEQRLLRVVTAG
jgi:anti-anti-sigma factor